MQAPLVTPRINPPTDVHTKSVVAARRTQDGIPARHPPRPRGISNAALPVSSRWLPRSPPWAAPRWTRHSTGHKGGTSAASLASLPVLAARPIWRMPASSSSTTRSRCPTRPLWAPPAARGRNLAATSCLRHRFLTSAPRPPSVALCGESDGDSPDKSDFVRVRARHHPDPGRIRPRTRRFPTPGRVRPLRIPPCRAKHGRKLACGHD